MSDFKQEYCFLKSGETVKTILTVIVKHVNEIHRLRDLENEVVIDS